MKSMLFNIVVEPAFLTFCDNERSRNTGNVITWVIVFGFLCQ